MYLPEIIECIGNPTYQTGGKDPLGRYYWERHGQDLDSPQHVCFFRLSPALRETQY